jgi:hypothetical protein
LIGAVVASKPPYEPLNSPFDLATNEHASNGKKFTQKYSKEAHASCVSHKIAPELYAVEKFWGGWIVVMKYLD